MESTQTVATDLPAPEAALGERSKADFRRYLFLIGIGLFVTTIGQPSVIGNLPFNFLFTRRMNLQPEDLAKFWAISSFAWYVKPLAGLLSDSIPLFGTRRRSYLLISATLAAVCWLLFAAIPLTYSAFLWTAVALATMMMIASTVTGGLLVEEGQRYGATGRLSSLRYGLDSLAGLIVGPIGGWLAARAFGWTVGAGATLMFTLVPAAFFLLQEPRTAQRDTEVWTKAWRQLKTIVRSHTMWAAAILFFLVYIAPNFGTPMFFYQTQTLQFSPQFIGNLGFLSGAGGILGALAYGYYCRRMNLRWLLVLGIVFHVASTLFYLGYTTHRAALIIEFGNGVFGTMAALPLFDLAARATPRGSESFGYALMMSIRNVTLLAISNVLGAYLYQDLHMRFMSLVWLNAITTALVILAVPFLPRALMNQREA
jgi:predicted MFS family arabinose efflux permease